MRRRRFVATAGALGAAAVAGCISNNGDDDGVGNGDDGDDPVGGPVPDERVDEPPHDPERPPEPDDSEEWNPDWLGEGMATEPSYPFEEVSASLADSRLDRSPPPSQSEYAVRLLTSTDDLESVVDTETAPERLETVDFDEELVVVVESGYGSSSVEHAWQRVTAVDGGLYLNGYRTDPRVGTTDYTSRHSILVVETTVSEDDHAHVSLTVSGDERVNFDSSDGVVTVDRSDDGNGGTGDPPSDSPPEERVDAPPHDPERPPDDDWNPDWLGAGMATNPSLLFETVETALAKSELADPASAESDPVFAASLLTSTEELESTIDMSDAPERLETVDFEEEVVVVVESGYGSSSVHHAWQRIAETDDGVYLNGYLRNPRPQTDDYAAQHSVVIVGKSAGKVGRADVSLTYSEDWRVNFDNSEGVVTTGEDDR